MDRPQVDRIEGIPPAIAIDQTNPVRTSRSTVGTMTELNDHLKLLFSRAAQLYCRDCGAPVRRDSAQSIHAELDERLAAAGLRDSRLVVTLPVPVPHNFSETEVLGLLEKQGYTRVFGRSAPMNGNGGVVLEMIQDRIRFASAERDRVIEALESALRIGRGRVAIHVLDDSERAARAWRFSSDLHCADCDIRYREPTPSLFSFNSPLTSSTARSARPSKVATSACCTSWASTGKS
jgi:excinuclease ABC subunit A